MKTFYVLPRRRCAVSALHCGILCWLAVLNIAHAATAVRTEGDFPTGLVPSSAADRLWLSENAPPVRTIELNATAIGRIQAFRRAQKLPPLPLGRGVTPGNELRIQAPTLSPRDKLRLLRIEGRGEIPNSVATVLPANVDNSASPGFPGIERQFGGSCTAMAATYYTGTYMLAVARGWSKTEVAQRRLSPKWSYNLCNDGADAGSSLPAVFRVMQLLGAPSWNAWKPDGDFVAWPSQAAVWRDAIPSRFHRFTTVPNLDTPAGVEQLKAALADGFVLPFGTRIYHWDWLLAAREGASSNTDFPLVGTPVCYRVRPVSPDEKDDHHAMTIVGYDDRVWVDINDNGKVDDGERGAFKVANSWGRTNQFIDGFGWIAYDALRSASTVSGAADVFGTTGRQPAIIGNEAYVIEPALAELPAAVAEFTLSHPNRSQLWLQVGSGMPGLPTPLFVWPRNEDGEQGFSPLQYAGGAHPFSGTIAMDLSDLTDGGTRRYLVVNDAAATGAATISRFRITNAAGQELASASGVPVTVDSVTRAIPVDVP